MREKFRWVICSRCDGHGKHVNPAIDGNGIRSEQVDRLLAERDELVAALQKIADSPIRVGGEPTGLSQIARAALAKINP